MNTHSENLDRLSVIALYVPVGHPVGVFAVFGTTFGILPPPQGIGALAAHSVVLGQHEKHLHCL